MKIVNWFFFTALFLNLAPVGLASSPDEEFQKKAERALSRFYRDDIKDSTPQRFYVTTDEGGNKIYRDDISGFTYDFDFVKINLYSNTVNKDENELHLCSRLSHLMDRLYRDSDPELFFSSLTRLFKTENINMVTIIGDISTYSKLRINGKMPKLKYIGDAVKDWAALFMLRAMAEGKLREAQSVIVSLIERALEDGNREFALNLYLCFDLYFDSETKDLKGSVLMIHQGSRLSSQLKTRFNKLKDNLNDFNDEKNNFKKTIIGKTTPLTHICSILDNLDQCNENWHNDFDPSEESSGDEDLDKALLEFYQNKIEKIKIRNKKRHTFRVKQRIANLPPLVFIRHDLPLEVRDDINDDVESEEILSKGAKEAKKVVRKGTVRDVINNYPNLNKE